MAGDRRRHVAQHYIAVPPNAARSLAGASRHCPNRFAPAKGSISWMSIATLFRRFLESGFFDDYRPAAGRGSRSTTLATREKPEPVISCSSLKTARDTPAAGLAWTQDNSFDPIPAGG